MKWKTRNWKSVSGRRKVKGPDGQENEEEGLQEMARSKVGENN